MVSMAQIRSYDSDRSRHRARSILTACALACAVGCASEIVDEGSTDDEGSGDLEPVEAGASGTDVADSFVNSAYPTRNYGTATALRVRNDSKRIYLRFRVASVSSGSTVSSAVIKLHAGSSATC